MSGAGYGNRSAPAPSPDNLAQQHSETRFDRSDAHPYIDGHDKYGSATLAGPGFGNKSAPNPQADTSDLRFGSHDDTAPYSGAGRLGSGSTGGAGWGNKTGSFSESHDSTVGKIMEKVGHAVKSDKLVEQGHAKRVGAGLGKEAES